MDVTADNLDAVVALETFGWQRRLVAPNLRSLAQALLPGDTDSGEPIVPWYRAIAADDELVGFVMVAAPTPREPQPYLWRLMIDRRHQRRGIGRVALALVVAKRWRGAPTGCSSAGSRGSAHRSRSTSPTGSSRPGRWTAMRWSPGSGSEDEQLDGVGGHPAARAILDALELTVTVN